MYSAGCRCASRRSRQRFASCERSVRAIRARVQGDALELQRCRPFGGQGTPCSPRTSCSAHRAPIPCASIPSRAPLPRRRRRPTWLQAQRRSPSETHLRPARRALDPSCALHPRARRRMQLTSARCERLCSRQHLCLRQRLRLHQRPCRRRRLCRSRLRALRPRGRVATSSRRPMPEALNPRPTPLVRQAASPPRPPPAARLPSPLHRRGALPWSCGLACGLRRRGHQRRPRSVRPPQRQSRRR